MSTSARALGLWASLYLLGSACTSLAPTREVAPDGDAATDAGDSDGGPGRNDGGDPGSGGSDASGDRDGGSGAQAMPDAGDGGQSGSGGSGGGAGNDGGGDEDGGPPPSGRCIGDGEMMDIAEGEFVRGDDMWTTSQPKETKHVEAFRIDRTEVTVVAYQDCVADGECTAPAGPAGDGHCNWPDDGPLPGRECHPVNCVEWAQAEQYCAWAGKRLPTETEWEFAARGPTPSTRIFPWGDESPDASRARWMVTDGTSEVGSFPLGETPQRVLDMGGNVWEWTSSEWCDSYEADPICDPSRHVDRGGGWETMEEQFMKSAFREADLEHSNDQFGFRCAK